MRFSSFVTVLTSASSRHRRLLLLAAAVTLARAPAPVAPAAGAIHARKETPHAD